MEATSAVVQAIQQSTQVQTVEMGGKEYFDRKVFLPPSESLPEPLLLTSLQSLVDFYKQEIGDLSGYFIHIEDPQTVKVLGLVDDVEDRHLQRPVIAIASYKQLMSDRLSIGKFINIEEMIIQLMAEFQDIGDRDSVLEIISNITTQDVTKVSDDGISQSVAVEKGFKVREAALKSIVTLHPFSTFREIPFQPSRQFLLRMRKGRGETDMPTVGLFRADGDGWKLDAMRSVKTWLEEVLEREALDVKVIA